MFTINYDYLRGNRILRCIAYDKSVTWLETLNGESQYLFESTMPAVRERRRHENVYVVSSIILLGSYDDLVGTQGECAGLGKPEGYAQASNGLKVKVFINIVPNINCGFVSYGKLVKIVDHARRPETPGEVYASDGETTVRRTSAAV